MRTAGPVDGNQRPAAKSWPALPRRCEKSSTSSNLGQERSNLEADRRKGQPTLRVQLVSQNDTVRCDPVWDGPRLVTAFAAQLIAQSLPDRRDAMAVETAYGSLNEPRKALLLDRKS